MRRQEHDTILFGRPDSQNEPCTHWLSRSDSVTEGADLMAKFPATPCVSVILPTFNRTKFLKLAVESVYAQTYADWEMIIADDGSAEETRTYLRSIAASHV